jgi:hypothetical protein
MTSVLPFSPSCVAAIGGVAAAAVEAGVHVRNSRS